MTPFEFFAAFHLSPYAVAAYALLHAHIYVVSRRVSAIELTPTVGAELGADLTRKAVMNPSQIKRLAELQAILPPERRTPEEARELAHLVGLAGQELPDDPSTPFVDETRSPNIGGGDYKREQLARDARETIADVRAFVRFARWVVSLFKGGGR